MEETAKKKARATGQLLAQGRDFPSSLSVLKWNRKFWEGVSLPYGETNQGLQNKSPRNDVGGLQSGGLSQQGPSSTVKDLKITLGLKTM